MSIRPCLHNQYLSCSLFRATPWNGFAYESYEMIYNRQDGADRGKIEEVTQTSALFLLRRFVVDRHACSGNEVSEYSTTRGHQGFLVNPMPCGVTRSKKHGLQAFILEISHGS